MTAETAIRWERDDQGVVTLTMDDPHQRVNTLNELFVRSFAAVIDRLEAERDTVIGVVLTSAKKGFLAGGDLKRLVGIGPADRQAFLDDLELRKSRMRRLERLGRPVVALVEGGAFGGGLELALVCHHRIALDSTEVMVGLPEVTLGLLPGGGGITRTTRLIGLPRALRLLVGGTRLNARQAHELGLIDDLATSRAEALEKARAWILANPDAAQPWDRGRPAAFGDEAGEDPVVLQPARDLAPAVATIREVAAIAASADVDTALRAESEGLADLVVSDAARATIAVAFFDTVRTRSRLRKAAGNAPARTPVLVVAGPVGRRTLAAGGIASVAVVSDGDAAGLSRLRAEEGNVVLTVAEPGVEPPAGDPVLWIAPDRLGDGGYVIEYAAADEPVDDVVARLARTGALAVPLADGEREGFGGRVAEAVRAAADEARRAGADPAVIERALVVAGLRPAPLTAAPCAREPVATEEAAGLGRRFVAAAVAAAVRLCDEGVLRHADDLDVASVRAGGVPAWTGGAGRWSADARQRSREKEEER
ncbi:enoyl-CoA hydratase-related protein [Streptosporangium sp. NPDC049304]|uniref:enoyl-CoA hydratase-related protein n=1 Tax=Streptosporangium sp. NPDC049304 TaxID=3154830 RepID=UPI003423E2B9